MWQIRLPLYGDLNQTIVQIRQSQKQQQPKQVPSLKEQGLIKGGALDNALVIIDKKIDEIEINRLRDLFGIEEAIAKGSNGLLNGKILRFKNEPVRHKTLDLIGDIALLGVPIIGHITAARAGHASNVEFVKKLKKVYAKELEELWKDD